ncbi:MAG: DNA polymerase III subunit delta [Thermoflexus sp.]|jgi:DNA polymerase-3 subunit delta|nr:DNA polymerase III subunit delta [Thermoflexus sp.]
MILLFHGENELEIEEALWELRREVGDAAAQSANVILLDGRRISPAELQAACTAMPFLAFRRLVIVEGWLARERRRAQEDEAFRQALSAVPPTTLLVLIERKTLPEGHPLLRWMMAHLDQAEVRHFPLPPPRALPEWVMERAQRYGGTFTPQAASALAALVTDLRLLDQEIQKLTAWAAGRPVTPQDVERLVPYAAPISLFELTEALGRRDVRRALAALHRLLEEGEHPLGLFGMIVRQFRLMLLMKEQLERGLSPAEAGNLLALHPYAARKIAESAVAFSIPQLETFHRSLAELDLAIKTGQVPDVVALETFIVSVGRREAV